MSITECNILSSIASISVGARDSFEAEAGAFLFPSSLLSALPVSEASADAADNALAVANAVAAAVTAAVAAAVAVAAVADEVLERRNE